jgi:hypothetical protein
MLRAFWSGFCGRRTARSWGGAIVAFGPKRHQGIGFDRIRTLHGADCGKPLAVGDQPLLAPEHRQRLLV